MTHRYVILPDSDVNGVGEPRDQHVEEVMPRLVPYNEQQVEEVRNIATQSAF